MIIDGQSYLLLIRDEGGAPEMQVSKLSNYLGCIFVINTSCLVLGPSHVYTFSAFTIVVCLSCYSASNVYSIVSTDFVVYKAGVRKLKIFC